MQPTLRADNISRKTGTQFEKPPDSSLVNPGSVEELLTSELTIASLVHWLYSLQHHESALSVIKLLHYFKLLGPELGGQSKLLVSYKALFNRVLS